MSLGIKLKKLIYGEFFYIITICPILGTGMVIICHLMALVGSWLMLFSQGRTGRETFILTMMSPGQWAMNLVSGKNKILILPLHCLPLSWKTVHL